MLTKKKHLGSRLRVVALILAIAWAAGCGPPGPRALLEGKRLIEQGKYALAVEKLRLATSLISTNAQAWNYLGLACHRAGQPADALQAYRTALKLNHDLVVVHYNLGCLLLEQNRPETLEEARDELTAFTLHQGNSLDGWLKLGATQLRLKDYGAAERTFNEALRLGPQNAEALNDLGVIQSQRNHPREAVSYFNAALKQQPNYAPALLNLAVTLQSSLNTRALALRQYQEYLALNPRPANWEAVNAAARLLEQELNPPAVIRPVAINSTSPPSPPVILPKLATTSPARSPVLPTNAPKTEPPTSPKVASVAPVKTSEQPVQTVQATQPVQPVQQTPAMQPEVVQLPEATAVKTADDSAASTQRASPPASTADFEIEPVTPAPVTPVDKSGKKGFFQKLNPANLFHRDTKPVATLTPLPPVVSTESGSTQATTVVSTNPDTVSRRAASPEVQPVWPRYRYLSPAKPRSGNRIEAERLFAQALQAQRDGRYADAVSGYRAATQADSSFFEAQCNLGLAAYDAGELPLSLFAYETALAITPASFNARFNFALALKKANYLVDAAQELERLLVINPAETQAHLAAAHLMLANLYSEQFHQASAARPHYLKVLELDPGNSQATAIRYWLRDNP